MFGRLKKSLKDSINKIARKAEEPEAKEKEAITKEKKPVEKKEPKKEPKKEKKTRKISEKPKTIKKKPEESLIEEIREEPKEEPAEELAEPEPIKEEPEEPKKSEPFEEAKEIDEEIEEEPEEKEKRGFFGLGRKITTRQLTNSDIDDFFDENETEFMTNNVAVEVIDFFRKNLKERLVEKPIKRTQVLKFVSEAFENSLYDILNTKQVDIREIIKKAKSEDRPVVLVFLGFNGSGKTTTMAKLAYLLQKGDYKIVFAAADTFRAAAQEQIELHGKKLGIRVIKHKYGADPAAVVYDAIEHAKSNDIDVVMADTAGRTHTNVNLANELKKICRVNKPDLKILVLDSLTGNDIISQGKMFDEMIGVDAVILTKVDVNTKGGSIMSAAYIVRKPILYLGVGQEYGDLEEYNAEKIAKQILG